MTDKGEEESKTASFGHDALCNQLVKRLDAQFKTPKRDIEPSLVIGLFGEWGSGKSHLLNLIEKHYNEHKATITIPIAFNPWRFEKEDHLIIPLMKTVELTLKEYLENNKNWLIEKFKGYGESIVATVDETSRLCAVSVVAFITNLKVGVSSTQVFDGEKTVKAFQHAEEKKQKERKQKEDKAAEEARIFDELNSIYFNFHQKLNQAIGHDNKQEGSPKINLLFLIDDIDRCLPEKAVEMLESIKLFLDVEGCAFVLAVDDEVVERGIIHRYRDYIFQQQSNGDAQLNTNPPITGAEYLEKIIHLPFRLPLPTRDEVRCFLKKYFKDVFSIRKQDNRELMQKGSNEKNEEETKNSHLDSGNKNQEKTKLLELFVNAVPRVPRKLIRAVEVYELQLEIMQQRGIQNIDEMTLARLVILQLLVPEIYRYGRQNHGFLGTLEYWAEKEELRNDKWLLPVEKNAEDVYDYSHFYDLEDKTEEEAKSFFDQYTKPLYLLIQKHNQQRSGFNIKNIISLKKKSDPFLKMYFSCIDEPKTHTGMGSSTLEGVTGGYIDDRPTLQLDNESEFIDLITSMRPDSWSTVSGMPGISDGRMSDALYKEFSDTLRKQLPITFDSAFCQPQWLSIIQPILPNHTNNEVWGQGETSLVDKLVENLREENEPDAKKRLHYGDCLAILGDPRKGVGVNNDLPDIKWQMVAKGDFIYGAEFEYSADKETKYLEAFEISRYPITNQQFQCFLDAKDKEDAKWWQDMPKDEFDNLTSSKWTQANRPKEGVSWYQAVAFTRWLSDKTGQTIRLPMEFEWEKAARGSDGREYPWGKTFKSEKLNSNKGDSLKETSTVGIYTEGKSPCGAYDMSGNVWEWCLNKYEKPEDITVDKKDDARVIRGGSFYSDSDYVRCAIRYGVHPDDRNSNLGFRIVRL